MSIKVGLKKQKFVTSSRTSLLTKHENYDSLILEKTRKRGVIKNGKQKTKI